MVANFDFFIFSVQLCGLTHCAFSLISKAGTVIDRELLEETLPISWELLLDGDQQLVSAAGESTWSMVLCNHFQSLCVRSLFMWSRHTDHFSLTAWQRYHCGLFRSRHGNVTCQAPRRYARGTSSLRSRSDSVTVKADRYDHGTTALHHAAIGATVTVQARYSGDTTALRSRHVSVRMQYGSITITSSFPYSYRMAVLQRTRQRRSF